MTVADLAEGERDLNIQCPRCRTTYFALGYNLRLQLPGETLLAAWVRRHVCRRCSRPGHKVRCQGWIQEPHRSGAEPHQWPVPAGDKMPVYRVSAAPIP